MKENRKNKKGMLLPSNKWLREHGLEELVRVMKKYPEKFAHIPQEKDKDSASG
jgi:hypothetical protein